MLLSILFAAPAQTTSIISHLVPGMYATQRDLPSSSESSTVVSLLHFLAIGYPSQSRYMEHLGSVPKAFLSAVPRRWLRDLTCALRQHNFARLERLTTRASALKALRLDPEVDIKSRNSTTEGPANLVLEAMCTLLDSLRARARETAWAVLRSAYRELSCPRPSEAAPSHTRDWLLRSLTLQAVAYKKARDKDDTLLDEWIQQRVSSGELRPKEGVDGRWIVCKAKS
jgi:hypothetical protein